MSAPSQALFTGTRAELFARLEQLPALLAGRIPDPSGTVAVLRGAIGLEALELIKDAYVTKSRGGTDEAGISWAPLTRRYVAYGRRHPGLTRKRALAGKAGRLGRPLLTAAQDRLWRQVFVRACKSLQRQGHVLPAGNAAALAWAVVKRAGGLTILGEYGGAKMEIGRDTGRLFNSLSPGMTPAPASRDQIFRQTADAVIVGTNVEYAEHFHRLRPLWPEPDRVPQVWWDRIGEILEDGMGNVLAGLAKG